MSETLENALTSLERIVTFDVKELPRREKLGEDLAFDDAVEPANKIIDLFRQVPLSTLQFFPDSQLSQIIGQADGFYNQLDEILRFDAGEAAQPKQQRDGLVTKLGEAYQAYFNHLCPLISYASGRIHDFSALETEGRAAIQSIRDKTEDLQVALQTSQNEAQNILDEVRKVAAEQGVSQQAIYFNKESEGHKTLAGNWQWATVITACGLGIFALASSFAYKIPSLAATNGYDFAQLAIGKVLIFGVIAYMLVLCARNFLSHKHNEIVNRHRQNALMTFTALVKAAGDGESKDIILTHAASCIFSPQETGYAKTGSSQSSAPPASMFGILNQLSKGQSQGT